MGNTDGSKSSQQNLQCTVQRIVGDQSTIRWGSNIPSYMLHRDQRDANIFFGYRVANDGSPYYVGKPQDKDGHVLVVGGAGSGKTSCIAIPTLRSWKGTFVAVDIKGELLKKAAPFIKQKDSVKVFSFSKNHGENLKYCRYDPLYLLRDGNPDDLVQNAREIAQAIIPIPPNIQEPFWSQAAQNVLTAVILYVCGLEERNPNTGDLQRGTFNQAMDLIQSEPICVSRQNEKRRNSP